MKTSHLQADLLFCRACRRHFRGKRTACPSDGSPLELVTPFVGQAGDVLDERYELGEQIGVGGMGTVFRAWDRQHARPVALKLLRGDYASNSTSARRFFQEARLLREIRHPGVVTLHRFGRTADGTLVIDMELVEGESVRDRVLRLGRGLETGVALEVLDQLLAALQACHDAGVVHCDVKPENIMVMRGQGRIRSKLVDFGIAQAPGPLCQNDEVGVVGTPAYMSPEQVRGAAVDARTDLYLVGCVAYELLSGEPPFAGPTPLDLCHHQMLTPAPSLQERLPVQPLPPGFETWVLGLLAKSPDERPASAAQVREALAVIRRRWAGQRDVAAAPPLDHKTVQAPIEPPVATLRPPSVQLLRRRPSAMSQAVDARARQSSTGGRRPGQIGGVRAVIEIRQLLERGIAYGPEAIEQIARHVLRGQIHGLQETGARVSGPTGTRIEVSFLCGGDERGTVSHLLDAVAAMQDQLARIPEPQLEIRAAVVADAFGGEQSVAGTGLDPLQLLDLRSGSQIRVDEHVARWAGRRALVRLGSVASASQPQPTDIYATSLHPM